MRRFNISTWIEGYLAPSTSSNRIFAPPLYRLPHRWWEDDLLDILTPVSGLWRAEHARAVGKHGDVL